MSNKRVLILTQNFQPHRIVPWDRAVIMLFQGKLNVLEEYNEVLYQRGEFILRTPAVAHLTMQVTGVKRAVKFSRVNVFTRDGFRCQYCGEKKKMRELNYDHVVPRHLGGKTNWENIATSCYPCNTRKRNRTPEQAGMRLIKHPHKPKSLPLSLQLRIDPNDIPPEWAGYCEFEADPEGTVSVVAA